MQDLAKERTQRSKSVQNRSCIKWSSRLLPKVNFTEDDHEGSTRETKSYWKSFKQVKYFNELKHYMLWLIYFSSTFQHRGWQAFSLHCDANRMYLCTHLTTSDKVRLFTSVCHYWNVGAGRKPQSIIQTAWHSISQLLLWSRLRIFDVKEESSDQNQ